MATVDQSGRVLEEVDVSDTVRKYARTGQITTGPDGMQEIGVVAQRVREDGLSVWLKPPRLYFLLAAVAGILYAQSRKR